MTKRDKFLEFIKWRGGGIVKFNSLLFNAMVFFYLCLAYRMFSGLYVRDVLLFILFSFTITTYGYIVNDFGDMELDRLHGKKNIFKNSSKRKALLAVIAVFLVSVSCGLVFVQRPGFLFIWIIWIILATFYSVPPLRLKEHGFIGLITPIIAQTSLPILMVFAVFQHLIGWDTLIFIVYVTCRGAVADVRHEMLDYENDVKTDTQTFAVQKGYNFIKRIFVMMRELEKAMLGVVLVTMLIKIPWITLPVGDMSVSPILPLFALYLFTFAMTISKMINRKDKKEVIDPYDRDRKDIFKFIHVHMPSHIIPFYLLVIMTLYYKFNIIILLLFALIYRLFSIQRWKSSWLFAIISKKLHRLPNVST